MLLLSLGLLGRHTRLQACALLRQDMANSPVCFAGMASKFRAQVMRVAAIFHVLEYVLKHPRLASTSSPPTSVASTPMHEPPSASAPPSATPIPRMSAFISAAHVRYALDLVGWGSTTALIHVSPNPFKSLFVSKASDLRVVVCMCARARLACGRVCSTGLAIMCRFA